MMPREHRRPGWSRADWLICLILVVVTLGLYSEVRAFSFVDFDDPDYATAPQVRDGVTLDAVKWAFTSHDAANWFPLTRLSHMLDYQLYGPQSGPAHLTSLAIHTLACVMLFLFLRRATGARWRSGFVAFLFAWHPLHVESVAWVAERKDVLCAFFWFLTSWLWVRYTEHPGWKRYVPALIAFCLGLMSKPMIVTLPVVLLLLNWWPLRRPFSRRTLWEIAPFFAMTGIGGAITFLAQQKAGAVAELETFPAGLRLANVFVSYVVYLVRTFWPANLAFWYPYPEGIDWRVAGLYGVALTAISVLAVRLLRRHTLPWLAVGWLWFVVTLIPVIGLIQVGSQARADRYMYIPMVGLLIALVWSAAEFGGRWARAAGVAICVAVLPVTWLQIQTWRDSRTLFTHATKVTAGNYVAWNNLGTMEEKIPGRLDVAFAYFETARRIKPGFAPAWYNRGHVELAKGELDEATADFQKALVLNPNYADARNNLGVALSRQGRWVEAILQLQEAVVLNPGRAEAQRNLGDALLKAGRVSQSVIPLAEAVRLAPGDASAHNMLGFALAANPERLEEAIGELREAIRLDPALATAHENLGRLILRTPGGRTEAVAELREALRINPSDRPTAAFLDSVEGSPSRLSSTK